MFIHPSTPSTVPGMGENVEEIPAETESAFENTLFTFQGKTAVPLQAQETQTPQQTLNEEDLLLAESAHSREMPQSASFPAEEPSFQTAVSPKEQEPILRPTSSVSEKAHGQPEEPILRTAPAAEQPFFQKQEPALRPTSSVSEKAHSHGQGEEPILRTAPAAEQPFLQKQEPVLRTAPAASEKIHSHVQGEEPILRTASAAEQAFLQKQEPVLRTAPAASEKIHSHVQGEEPILKIAPKVAPLDPAPVSLDEPPLKTAPLAVTQDHAQSATLPQDDGIAQLKEQVGNLPQPAATNEAPAPAEAAPSMANTNFVLQPAQRKTTEPTDPATANQHDPRIDLGNTKTAERAKVSLEAQLDQANFQLSQGNVGKPVEPGKESYVFTSAAFKHAVKEEPQEIAMQQRLNQQFRQIPAGDSLETKNPQPLREFSQTMNFDASVNPSGKSKDFEAPTAVSSRNAAQRQAPHLAEVFTMAKQEETTEPSQTFTELDTQFDQFMTESRDKPEVVQLKESRPASELNPARTFKESDMDLEQIMSKVNIKDKGTQEVILQLAPKELGNLKMTIRQEGNDISVEMIVANPEVKQILEANLPELRARFLAQEEASFDQLQFAVDVEQHSFSQSGQSPERGGFEEDYFSQKQQEAPAELPVSEQYRKAGYNSGVSVYA